ncbi:hypothetical protein E1176_12645 [Fulvivirga sp. RKSG066]|uniref:hypothetical protein n=1 Tax=Fulvivirga aurantia TaxID=2529383 RepID=UPI0012BB5C93|nr:hypothetical protein [Fulvivirga aurantia]MTI21873.1 hypothetical protein [Fulvivirga aurantia]
MSTKNTALLIGGSLSALASITHVFIVIGGPDWYRFFGAGEGLAQLAANGSNYPAMLTSGIAAILATWALYAFSGAGIIRKLPLLKPALVLISFIFMSRALFGIPATHLVDDPYMKELADKPVFMLVSSVICLAIGLCYSVGTWKLFQRKRNKTTLKSV